MNKTDSEVRTETARETDRQQERLALYREIIPYLLHWYEYNRRILPWREDPTPYHVWVSEIMLQQTRVEAVKGYYDRFLTCLPTVEALALAEEETLLKLWEGLGYYNRVRNMQKAARVLKEEYGGELPADYEAIRALPGIGDYTAGAVASIAFGLPYPAVDGNVLRVMSRIACDEADITKEQTKRKLKEDLINVFLAQRADMTRKTQGGQPEKEIGIDRGNLYGDFNQSLMELGATVCLPNGKPLCEQCPVMHLCKAFHAGRENELPVKSGKKERRIEKRRVYVISYEGKILLHRREKKGLLAGLWEFPNVLVGEKERGILAEEGNAQRAGGEELSKAESPFSDLRFGFRKTKRAKHIFSHVEWHMEGVFLETESARNRELSEEDIEEIWLEDMKLFFSEENRDKVRWEIAGNGSSAEAVGRRKHNKAEREQGNSGETEWVLATMRELSEKYAIPSAFEAFLKELQKGEIEEGIEEKTTDGSER